jgi:Iron-sulfur cluster-binding domain
VITHRRPGTRVAHTIETNGVDLDDDWCAFFAATTLSSDQPKRHARAIGAISSFRFSMTGAPATMCIFAETCGNAVTVEHSGDVYSCDRFVEPKYLLGNIGNTHLLQIVSSDAQKKFGAVKRDALPRYCRRGTGDAHVGQISFRRPIAGRTTSGRHRSAVDGLSLAHRLVRMSPAMNGQLPSERVSMLALLVLWILSSYRRLTCAVMGHRTILQFEPRRLALRCVECGHETPGWSIGKFVPREVLPQRRATISTEDRAA